MSDIPKKMRGDLHTEITPEQEKRICRAYDTRVPLRDLAVRFRISSDRVREILVKHGRTIRTGGRAYTGN